MVISVVTLNIEGDKHFDRFIPVLQKLQPDVVCLQEVFKVDVPQLAAKLGFSEAAYSFLPMTKILEENQYHIPPKGEWGVALFTKLEHSNFATFLYKGTAEIPTFTTPNSVNRGLLMTTVTKGETSVPIATTHFTWTGNGESSDEQRTDFKNLKNFVGMLPPHVLCGDFNSPRGKETFTLFETLYTDGLPKEVTTTIDGTLHYSGGLELVVDTVFYQAPLAVEKVTVLEGVSDHKGLYFEIV